MKIITISKMGYNHPSGANWNYGVWKIDLIDTEQTYCMSYTVKETFGGDYRLKEKLNSLNIKYIETRQLFTTTELQKLTGVCNLLDIESDLILKIIKEFMLDIK